MTRTAYLHMGANKTGSSAIQAWVAAHDATLATAGIAVPTAHVGATGNAPRLANALCLPAAELPADGAEARHGFAKWLIGQDSDILISAEKFSTFAAQGHMRRCAALFRNRGFRICAVIYVRNQIDRINSSVAQRSKRLRKRIDLTAPMDNILDDRENWAACLQTIKTAGFDLRVGVYPLPDRAVSMPEHLMTKLGLRDRFPDDTDFTVGHANPSLGELGVLLANRIAHQVGDLSDAQRQSWSLAVLDAFKDLPDKPFNGFNQDEMDQLEQRYAAGNALMTRWLNQQEMSSLTTSKSRGRPPSPRRMEEMDNTQANIMATAIDRLCGTVESSDRLNGTLPPDAIRALLPDMP